MWEFEETEEVNTSVCPIIILTTCCVFIFPTCLAVSSSPVVLWPNSSVLCATVWWVENEHGLKRTASLWDVLINGPLFSFSVHSVWVRVEPKLLLSAGTPWSTFLTPFCNKHCKIKTNPKKGFHLTQPLYHLNIFCGSGRQVRWRLDDFRFTSWKSHWFQGVKKLWVGPKALVGANLSYGKRFTSCTHTHGKRNESGGGDVFFFFCLC